MQRDCRRVVIGISLMDSNAKRLHKCDCHGENSLMDISARGAKGEGTEPVQACWCIAGLM